MDLTPIIPAGRQIIETYGNGRFKVAGVVWEGSILVLPSVTRSWPVQSFSAITPEGLAEIFGAAEVLLLGCGERSALVPRPLREALKAKGIVVDAMDTGAASRTYNVLLAEDRRVAAALIAL